MDFDEDGSLLVKKKDGEITKVMSGDVSVRGIRGMYNGKITDVKGIEVGMHKI